MNLVYSTANMALIIFSLMLVSKKDSFLYLSTHDNFLESIVRRRGGGIRTKKRIEKKC